MTSLFKLLFSSSWVRAFWLWHNEKSTAICHDLHIAKTQVYAQMQLSGIHPSSNQLLPPSYPALSTGGRSPFSLQLQESRTSHGPCTWWQVSFSCLAHKTMWQKQPMPCSEEQQYMHQVPCTNVTATSGWHSQGCCQMSSPVTTHRSSSSTRPICSYLLLQCLLLDNKPTHTAAAFHKQPCRAFTFKGNSQRGHCFHSITLPPLTPGVHPPQQAQSSRCVADHIAQFVRSRLEKAIISLSVRGKQSGLITGTLWQEEFAIQALHGALPKMDEDPKNINKHILTSPLLGEAKFYREEHELGHVPTEIHSTQNPPAPLMSQQQSPLLESEASHHSWATHLTHVQHST